MRPLQARLYPLIITDVLAGNPPESVAQCIQRYMSVLGPAWHFETTGVWHGELREQAVWCLFGNGFAKGRVVRLDRLTGQLSDWVVDRQQLERAAKLEVEFGGFKRNASVDPEQIRRIGTGQQAVYVYSDSFLDARSISCCKIGRHDSSDTGSVINRIMSQYGTGNPGAPVPRLIAAVEDAIGLERAVQSHFSAVQVKNGVGTEWYETTPDDVGMFIAAFLTEIHAESKP